MNIFVFGDSIAHGMWDSKGGWAIRLKKLVYKKVIPTKKQNKEQYLSLYNLSIPGNTTENVLKRFEFEITQRLDPNQENLIIFAVGVNDSVDLTSEKRKDVPLPEFKRNLEKLLKLAGKYSRKIFFVGLCPVDEGRVKPVFWEESLSFNNKDVALYDKTLKEFCKKNNINFIEVFSEFDKRRVRGLLEDGIHPNSKGHKLIFEIIERRLKNLT